MYHIRISNTINAIENYTQGFSALAFTTHDDALSCAHKAAESAVRYLNENIPDVTVHIYKGSESASIRCYEIESAHWEVFEGDFMLHIESRNVDCLRVTHEFQSVDEMLADWNSDDPTMGDNEILLVVQNGMVLYSSMGKSAERYEDTLRTADVMEWFAPLPDMS